MKEPSSWAMKAATSVLYDYLKWDFPQCDFRKPEIAALIDSAHDEHWDAISKAVDEVFGDKKKPVAVPRDYAARVDRLVAAAKEVHGELHGLHNGSGYWIRFCSALADLEK